MEEKEKLLKQIGIYEQNKALFNQHLDQMKLQYEEQNDVTQKSLNQINALKGLPTNLFLIEFIFLFVFKVMFKL